MAQVFGNLITNSLRYTPENGKIILGVYRQDNDLVLSVKDTGSGISHESLPPLFYHFYQVETARIDANESGPGLAIAKSVVEAHAGTISAESEVGHGTILKITFPISRK